MVFITPHFNRKLLLLIILLLFCLFSKQINYAKPCKSSIHVNLCSYESYQKGRDFLKTLHLLVVKHSKMFPAARCNVEIRDCSVLCIINSNNKLALFKLMWRVKKSKLAYLQLYKVYFYLISSPQYVIFFSNFNTFKTIWRIKPRT